MNFIDIIILIILIFFAFRGFNRGFIYELFSIAILIIGLLASFLFFKQISVILNQYINNRELSYIVAFLAIFIGITISLITIRNILSNLIESLNITEIDNFLGLIFSIINVIFVVSFVLIFLERHPVFGIEKAIGKSLIFPYIKRVFFAVVSVLPIKIRVIIFNIF